MVKFASKDKNSNYESIGYFVREAYLKIFVAFQSFYLSLYSFHNRRVGHSSGDLVPRYLSMSSTPGEGRTKQMRRQIDRFNIVELMF